MPHRAHAKIIACATISRRMSKKCWRSALGIYAPTQIAGSATAGPLDDPAKAVNIGVAAHITAASPGGPRFDDTLTSESAHLTRMAFGCVRTTASTVALTRAVSPSIFCAGGRLRQARALQAIEAPARQSDRASSVERDAICRALLELHDTGVHKILNAARAPQHLRDSYPLEWLRKAQQWDADVRRVMVEIGCEPGEVQFVHTFTLGAARRSDLSSLT